MRDKARWLVVCRKCRRISRVCGEYTDYNRSHHHPGAQFWVGSSRNWSVFLERPNTGRHEKAPVRCPCSRLAALHDAPRTLEHIGLVVRMSILDTKGRRFEPQHQYVFSLSKRLYPHCFSRLSCEMSTRWGQPREGCSVL